MRFKFIFLILLLFAFSGLVSSAEQCFTNKKDFVEAKICGSYSLTANPAYVNLRCEGTNNVLYYSVNQPVTCSDSGCSGIQVLGSYKYNIKEGDKAFYGCCYEYGRQPDKWAWASQCFKVESLSSLINRKNATYTYCDYSATRSKEYSQYTKTVCSTPSSCSSFKVVDTNTCPNYYLCTTDKSLGLSIENSQLEGQCVFQTDIPSYLAYVKSHDLVLYDKLVNEGIVSGDSGISKINVFQRFIDSFSSFFSSFTSSIRNFFKNFGLGSLSDNPISSYSDEGGGHS